MIVVGAALENYTGFRAISDAFRQKFYDGVYRADLRDQILYGRIRPKLFTSEPSALTFAYTLFAFLGVLAPWRAAQDRVLLGAARRRLLPDARPDAAARTSARVPYELLLAPRRPVGTSSRDRRAALFPVSWCSASYWRPSRCGQHTLRRASAGSAQGADPSFFSRELGPFLVAKDVLTHHPIAGAGVTGEEYIAERVRSVYFTPASSRRTGRTTPRTS